MATITFSTLPAEVHATIAEHCENNDLINLCLTSKLVNERCLRILYRYVDLERDRDDKEVHYTRTVRTRKRQQQFVNTLLSHPEYGDYVRFLKTGQPLPSSFNCNDRLLSEEEFWHVMQSLSHVRSVEVISKPVIANGIMVPFPNNLFQSAKSVRLVGSNLYDLAKSILNTINPEMLKHLCLDMVDDDTVQQPQGGDGRIIALRAESGLLKNLTGRCTALQTLTWRTAAHGYNRDGWYTAREIASYIAWASFIHSVQGTVENFTFELVGGLFRLPRNEIPTNHSCPYAIADENFRQLILPAIISGSWPCLNTMKIRGVSSLNGRDGEVPLAMELRAVLGGNTKIAVEEPGEEPGSILYYQ